MKIHVYSLRQGANCCKILFVFIRPVFGLIPCLSSGEKTTNNVVLKITLEQSPIVYPIFHLYGIQHQHAMYIDLTDTVMFLSSVNYKFNWIKI